MSVIEGVHQHAPPPDAPMPDPSGAADPANQGNAADPANQVNAAEPGTAGGEPAAEPVTLIRRLRRGGLVPARLSLGRLWAGAPLVLGLVGALSMAYGRPAQVSGWGLITGMPPLALGCLGLLGASFVAALRARPRSHLLLAHVVVLIVLLSGAPALLEDEPRFGVSYLHAGFVEYISRTGKTLPTLDARMSWTGFFAAAAFVGKVAGIRDPVSFLRWAPVVLDLLYIAPLYVIARAFVTSVRVRWLAVWFFFALDWVGQDYFSPQGIDFLLYLSIVAVAVTYFRPVHPRLPAHFAAHRRSRVREWIAREPPPVTLAPWQQSVLAGVLALLIGTSVASHQMTPIVLFFALAVLVAFRRLVLRGLPLLTCVLVAAWLSYAASTFWMGHLNTLFGGVGNLHQTVGDNVGSRVAGDAAHLIVLKVRMALTGALWVAGAATAVVRLARGRFGEWTLLLLAGSPFPVIAVQSYGGEALLRVFMLSLPFFGILAALAFLDGDWRKRARFALLGVTVVLALPVFLITRYGNENFEEMRKGEVQAVHWLYAHAPHGSDLYAINTNVPWRFQDVEAYRYAPEVDPRFPERVIDLVRAKRSRPLYLIVTTSQGTFGETTLNYPPHSIATLETRIAASGLFTLRYSNADARVYQLNRPAGGNGS